MMRRLVGSLALVIVFTGLVAAQDKTKDLKKPRAQEVAATVARVEVEKGVLTVTTDDGKVLAVPIADGVRLVGPLGGVSNAGLKDDRLAKGAAVTLVMDPTGKKVVEVRLPTRSPGAAGVKIEGKITRVDVAKGLLTVTTRDGKKTEVAVSEDTKFFGPLGGRSDAGLKDDRVKAGAEVTLVLDKSGSKLLEVRLPRRDGEPAKDKDAPKKDKPADKPKDKR